MNYSEFTMTIAEKAKKTAGNNSRVSINQVLKNNDTRLDGLVIMGKDQFIVPTIYLNDYYNKYKNGMSIDSVMDEIFSVYNKNRDNFDLNTENFKSYEKMKHRIVYKLINYKMNEELLKKTPHKKFLDLAVVYNLVLHDKEKRLATALISNDHLENWEVDADTVDAQAALNTPGLFPARIRPIEKVLDNITNGQMELSIDESDGGISQCDDHFYDPGGMDDPCSSMFVLTNTTGINGAACILYNDPLKCFGQKIRHDFYILPSSVHEVILVPGSEGLKKEDLTEMVREINKTEVSPNEVLSDSVYEYDHAAEKLRL